MSSSSPNKNHMFRSQQIQYSGSPPLLLAPNQSTNSSNNGRWWGSATNQNQNINNKLAATNTVSVSSSIVYGFDNQKGLEQDHSSKENNNSNNNNAAPTMTWHASCWKIEASLIPSLNIYYMLEPTSITLKQIPIPVVEHRMSEFLRVQSIAYSYDNSSVRLDCVSDTNLKFVIQFWRVGKNNSNKNGSRSSSYYNRNHEQLEDPNQALTVELQRRQGSVVEMQSIRKLMFRALLTGEQPTIPDYSDDDQAAAAAPMKHHHRTQQPPLPDIIMAEIDANYDPNVGRAEAMEICLRLLESPCIDQSRLGLESLKMLTEPSIVSKRDAVYSSRSVVFGDGPYGDRLQDALSGYFSGCSGGGGGGGGGDTYGMMMTAAPSEVKSNETTVDHGDLVGHAMVLDILSNALSVVLDDEKAARNHNSNENQQDQPETTFHHTTASTDDCFWALAMQDLCTNVERATIMPHEGAKSAKCIRLLNDLQTRGQTTAATTTQRALAPTIQQQQQAGLRTCLAQAHQFGQRFHLSLERESQKLLAMDGFPRAH